jgi:uncharacterized protein (DUF488 family)
MRLWSIGHSTRSLEELITALRAHHIIEALADVRSFPRSARHPQFNEENLARELPRAGIAYCWLGKELGGYRKRTRPDSSHTALRSAGFRHYADHMETDEFKRGVEALLELAARQPTAYMCAERLWWRCHRSLLSDYLTAIRGVQVIHIHDEKKAEPHRLHRTVRVAAGRLVYDVGESTRLALE